MSVRTPSKTGVVRDCCVEGRRGVTPRAVYLLPVCLTVNPVGEPDALIGHVRFDERGWETGRGHRPQATAPILDSTDSEVADDFHFLGRSGLVVLTAILSEFDRCCRKSR